MKTKFTILLTALCLTMAPLTWADEIHVELDIIDDLKDIGEWEFSVLELEGLDDERTDEPTDELAENDEPRFDETDDIPEPDHLIAEVDAFATGEMDGNDDFEPIHELDEAMDDADEMDESNVDDLKDESDIADGDHMDEPTDEPMDEPVDEPMDEPMEEVVDEPMDEPIEEVADEPFDESMDEPMDEPMDEVVGTEGMDGPDENPIG